ncbi:MAG: AMP-binding protein [Bacteroidota bacterium]
MKLLDFYQEVCKEIADGNMDALSKFSPPKPEYFNWVEDFFYPNHVGLYAESPALIWKYKEQEKIYSFSLIYDRCNQLVNFLRKHGISQKDTIYTMLPLVPENWISFMATIKGGFILMPTATNLVKQDLVYRFETLFPEVIIAQDAYAQRIDEAETEKGQKIKLKIILGESRDGWLNFEDIFEESANCEAAPTKSDDPFLYFFTSGTTGLPKIVVHSHFTYPVGHLSTLSWLGCRRGDIHYNISSPGWAKFAWSSFFAPWIGGATILANQVDTFVPKEQLATMEKYKVSTFCGSPTVIRMLIQEDFSKFDLNLRSCCAAGEPLNPDVIDKWEKATGITIRDGYGQTETTALVGNLLGGDLKPGSMGKSTFLYEIGIFDEEGNEVPPLEEGVICVKMDTGKCNGIFLEYLNDQERTSNSFKHNLYYTGDKAYKDAEGYIWFIGRNDDVIKASAYRIGPFEVESVLIEHDAIVEAAVVASPHPMRGYAVKAFVMLKEGVEANESLARDIFAFTEERLAKYKVPRIIEFPEALPKTISGKIRRIELRANEANSKLKEESRIHEYFHPKY